MIAVRSRSRRRRLAFAALALLLTWLVLELGGYAAWWLTSGGAFTWQRGDAARERALAGSSALADASTSTARPPSEPLALHPYLGYVYDPTQGIGGISQFGFIDAAPPLRERRADRFVVAVTGGSVALMFANQVADHFGEMLQRSSSLTGRTVEVVSLALGGYKQPQQLLALQLLYALGAHFDCVVDIDGFNEIVLANENVPRGVPAWFPRSWARLVDSNPTTEQQLRLGQLALLRAQRRELAAGAAWCRWSPLGQFVWLARDRAAERRLQDLRTEIERAAASPSFVATGPGTGGMDLDAARAEMVAIWARCSRAMHALCRDHGTIYCHCLQPNQYVPGGKPIGAEEAARAVVAGSDTAQAIATFFPRLQQQGEALRRDGVPFFDLTTIYRDHPEPLYVDVCCHLGQAGNLVMAEYVAAAVRSQLDLAGITIRSLRTTPAELQFDSPLPRHFTVTAIDTAGGEHDLSGLGHGVRFTSSPPDLVRAGADGRLRAVRRGVGSLRVAYGTNAIDVPVAAQWPDQLSDGAAFGPRGQPGPVLAVDARPDADLVVQIAAIPDGPCRLLVWSYGPLPDKPADVDTHEIGTQLLLAASASASASTSIPARPVAGKSLFVRLFVLGPDAIEVIAASNTVVLTP